MVHYGILNEDLYKKMDRNEKENLMWREFLQSPLLDNINKNMVENVTLRAENAFLKEFILNHIGKCYDIDLQDIKINRCRSHPPVKVLFSHVFTILNNCDSIEEARQYLEYDLDECLEFMRMSILEGDSYE
ncbi:hypothetical protein [Methanobrevibacter sp.]|uniref:hypothetical protein n=1 Tax=Methanobrevibacter sp. TaxID=66852 RepID=UPI00386C90FC